MTKARVEQAASDEERGREIMERVEEYRRLTKLTKTAFASKLGFTPQSYNNFTGAQQSKPSLRLILNMCEPMPFGVNPMWLLFGRGKRNR